jgi:hypothetical protein
MQRVQLDIVDQFPGYAFTAGDGFMWSPRQRVITYDPERLCTNAGRLALLHEIGHARLRHRLYRYDLELLQMEIEAWEVAAALAPGFNVLIDQPHIDRAIASYDHWLTKRATCPDCSSFGIQRGRDQYGCFTCGTVWAVNWRPDRRVRRIVTSRYATA